MKSENKNNAPPLFNKLLKRQIRKYFGNIEDVPPNLYPLLQAISESYDHYETDRLLTERSLDISSKEFAEVNEKLRNKQLALEQSNRELRDYAHIVSHDLKEPLRNISSFIQLIEKKIGNDISEEVKEFMHFCVSSVDHMNELLERLLDYSKVNENIDQYETCKLINILYQVKAMLYKRIEDTNTQVNYLSSFPIIRAKKNQIGQLFINLISNAIKFRKHNQAPVINITCQQFKRDYYLFCVADNGIGIPAEYTEQVFTIFQRLHTRQEYRGAGIGLTICRKIVENHGGTIWIDTNYTKGTKICFTLFNTENI